MKSKGPVTVVDGLITLAIPCFVIWVVRVRIRDLEAPKGLSAVFSDVEQLNSSRVGVRKPVCTCGRGYGENNNAAFV